MRPRDNQRSKVYKWEDANNPSVCQFVLSLEECSKLVNKVSTDLGLLRIDVLAGNRYKDPAADKNRIWLPVFARTTPIVLHEVAHCIMDQNFDWHSFAPHGPEFVRVYMWLLQKYHGGDIAELKSTADQRHIKYSPDEFIDYVRKTALIQCIYFGLKDLSVKQLARIMMIIAKEGLV